MSEISDFMKWFDGACERALQHGFVAGREVKGVARSRSGRRLSNLSESRERREKRNAAVVAMWKRDPDKRAIGAAFGLTPQGVDYVVKHWKGQSAVRRMAA